MMNRLCNLFFFFKDFEIVELRLCCRQWGSLNLGSQAELVLAWYSYKR